jgi:hypothetical protein
MGQNIFQILYPAADNLSQTAWSNYNAKQK